MHSWRLLSHWECDHVFCSNRVCSILSFFTRCFKPSASHHRHRKLQKPPGVPISIVQSTAHGTGADILCSRQYPPDPTLRAFLLTGKSQGVYRASLSPLLEDEGPFILASFFLPTRVLRIQAFLFNSFFSKDAKKIENRAQASHKNTNVMFHIFPVFDK